MSAGKREKIILVFPAFFCPEPDRDKPEKPDKLYSEQLLCYRKNSLPVLS